jgi:predicted lipoprotein with Yx(FWY)xxD motif
MFAIVLAGAAVAPLSAPAVASTGRGHTSPVTAAQRVSVSAAKKTIEVRSTRLGKILVDSQGRTLYLFKKDSRGKSACSGECAKFWPPLRVRGRPSAGSSVSAAKLGTLKRSDGTRQVTYNGHPLYTFQQDSGPGQTHGQGLTAFGAAWFDGRRFLVTERRPVTAGSAAIASRICASRATPPGLDDGSERRKDKRSTQQNRATGRGQQPRAPSRADRGPVRPHERDQSESRDDYNAWYDDYENAIIRPGLIANAFRFENPNAVGTATDPRYATIYDIVSPDPASAWPAIENSGDYPRYLFDDPRSRLVAPALRASYALTGSLETDGDHGGLTGVHVILSDGGSDTIREQRAAASS